MEVNVNSIWTETVELPSFKTLKEDATTDVLIIGGGLAGILCAYMLQQANVSYMLVEANTICSGITKNTTAKLTALHGLIFHKLIKRFGVDKTRLYLQANLQALNTYEEMCSKIDCDYEKKSSYVYSIDHREKLQMEMEALDKIGYQAKFVEELALPFDTRGAVKFYNQAQFHPLKFVAAIASKLNIYEHTKVVELKKHEAVTARGTIKAKDIIVATHFPIINKHGAYFLKMYQSRSYVLALEGAQDVDGMYVDEADKGMSFRNQGELLLLGGGDHRTGKKGGNYKELIEFGMHYYPKASIKYQWATQDCMTLDEVPYIGKYGKNTEGFYVTTGYNKWGMTSSMVSAMLLRDMILEKENEWSNIFSTSRTILRPQLLINGGEAVSNLVRFTKKRCPHMGCALKWNNVEKTWDCPCHGSRFTKDGELIDNPATDDL